ncbi:phage holin family protein [Wenxinia marina]|uniref:Holin-X, holin superfamily III n=1 Tax=Wenxinia marina DSM 24838 TaxID=1123501 RepID=A0A0D0NI80_9RHOB|nr:phage holin family protein [Wenxinia marina]KIQ68030.1 hypothetical protein Wenmar_03486 [Wenxinia marina DSM 24838]GGL75277.1 membrane protein [Wenxinia marina]
MRDETHPTDKNTADNRGIGSLLSDAMQHVSALVRGEIDLAKAEARQAMKNAVAGIAMIVAAVVVAICALNVLTVALVAAIADGFEIGTGWASLIVGLIYLVVVWILIAVARNRLKPENLTPSRTARNVADDARAIKESTQHG